MISLRAALLALVVVAVPLAGAVPTAAAPAPDSSTVDRAEHVDQQSRTVSQNDTSNSSLGSEISSFMQTSVSQTKGTVDTGMWTAAFDNTENQSVQTALVEGQTAELQQELQRLRQRKRTLNRSRGVGEMSDLEYRAKMSALIGEIKALRSAVNTTAERAHRTGGNVTALRRLGQRTENVTGTRVHRVARGLSSVTGPEEDDRGNGFPGFDERNRTSHDGTDNGNDKPGNGRDRGGTTGDVLDGWTNDTTGPTDDILSVRDDRYLVADSGCAVGRTPVNSPRQPLPTRPFK